MGGEIGDRRELRLVELEISTINYYKLLTPHYRFIDQQLFDFLFIFCLKGHRCDRLNF